MQDFIMQNADTRTIEIDISDVDICRSKSDAFVNYTQLNAFIVHFLIRVDIDYFTSDVYFDADI